MLALHKLVSCENSFIITLNKNASNQRVWKLAPRFLSGIDYLLFFLGRQQKNAGFYYCVMKPFQTVCICEEKQIRIIIVNGSSLSSVPSVSGESTCCSQSWLVRWDDKSRLLCYLLYYAAHRSQIRITLWGSAMPRPAEHSMSGLKPCASGPWVSIRKK